MCNLHYKLHPIFPTNEIMQVKLYGFCTASALFKADGFELGGY